MSSWRAVLTILVLLQRKMLIETKNRTLKYLNGTIQLCKLIEDGAFALFFIPTSGDLTAQESPPPGICHPRQKNANALQGSACQRAVGGRKRSEEKWLFLAGYLLCQKWYITGFAQS